MPDELLADMGLNDVNLSFVSNYSLPFLDLRVTSNCRRVLRYLDFYLEPFRSLSLESLSTFYITLHVDEPELSSRVKRIFSKCDDTWSTRVCYSPTSSRVFYEDGIYYFKANEHVFGVIQPKKRLCLVIFNRELVFYQRAPLFRVFIFALTEILTSSNCVLLHAASLVHENGGLCVVGASGAGKTTLLLSLLRTGRYKFLGDEWCLVKLTNEGWRIGSLTPKVRVPLLSLQYFQELGGFAHRIAYLSERKMYVDPRKIYGDCFRTCCSPMCILFLEKTEGLFPGIEPIGSFDAINKVVENVFTPLAHEGFLQNFHIASELIHQTKTFRFVRSPVLEESIRLVDSIVGNL